MRMQNSITIIAILVISLLQTTVIMAMVANSNNRSNSNSHTDNISNNGDNKKDNVKNNNTSNNSIK